MNRATSSRAAQRFTAYLLVILLSSGCATRKVEFSSAPIGAMVTVGDRQGVTPCTLKIPEGETHAEFSLPTGEVLELALPEIDNDLEDASDSVRTATAGSLKGVGIVVGAVGLGLLVLWGVVESCDEEQVENDINEDMDRVGVAGAGGVLAGLVLIGMGHMVEPSSEHPALHADFGWDDEQLYELDDYGVKRIRDVSKPR